MSALAARIVWLVCLVLAGYAGVCLYVFFKQRQMLYHPRCADEADMLSAAREVGLERWIDSRGAAIGWMEPGGSTGPPVLVFQGNGGNPLGRITLIERLRQAGISAQFFILDYPGYGSRPGRPTQAALTGAAVAALDALPAPAVLLGESLGTGVAAQAAARRPDLVRGLILVTPFDSMVDAAAHHYPWLPVGWLMLDRFDSVTALDGFPKPVAVIVAERDGTTPPEGGRRLAESLRGPHRLWIVPGSDHNEAGGALSDSDWRDVWDFVSPR